MLPDTPADLLKNDFLGTKEKAEFIKEFIKDSGNRDYLRKNNMIVLYGNWGSGKSSVIKYIHDELNKEENFKCIIFNAWLYERDDNLPYSLLEFILDELEKDGRFKHNIKIAKDKILKTGFNVFGGILKGFSINFSPIFPISYNPKDTIEHFEKMNEIKSHYKEIDELISEFKYISDILKDKTLIVFIDELDRCEPEHILDLLASIKLFFACGKNIIYFVAVDKEAVSKAIKTKYGDIIKAEEYLEKIFNISFSMPKDFELKKFIKQYEFFNDDDTAEKLEKFFKSINFTNPRHLKKVLNKYELLVRIKNLGLDKNELIPEIIRIVEENGNKRKVGYLLDTVFVLYFIILYEVYPEKYLEVKRYNYRIKHLKYITTAFSGGYAKRSTPYFDHYIGIISKNNLLNAAKLSELKKHISDKNDFIENVIRFKDLMTILKEVNDTNYADFDKFINGISIFLSCVGDENIDDETNFAERYLKAGITVDFWTYIKNHYEDLKEKNYSNPYPFTNLFKMVETLL
ncbi:KAP family P-loop NTPase fold protein [Methanotorris igneus]|uniref:KAP P-loop domain protein n=1 Tax=Methanotorris igneus (strain DSM 5666 / JCM 11834 / Kol 5) TaxID=880724 RepID=F6BEC5_METIK|nr:KAP P-loop domain-containing protein [Methanotorris igneus]AEF96802.1 KAP P-loop domain protein [Methanotorris igneus Kol 5]